MPQPGGSQTGRAAQGSRGSADDGGGDIVKDDPDCMKHYNLYETCPSPKLSTGVVHPVAGMTCQKSCYCPSEYIYSSSNCAGEYQVSGTACDGKYNALFPQTLHLRRILCRTAADRPYLLCRHLWRKNLLFLLPAPMFRRWI
ncbi:MAG: hypothetical protein ACLU99_12415 [Alphaproteobacteria bacterium]